MKFIKEREKVIKEVIKDSTWVEKWSQQLIGERGGSVVACRTPEREVGGSKPIAAVLCPWARHFTPRKYCG